MELGDGGGDKPVDSGGEKRDIRRPMNAFLIFCKRHRSMVREKHPDRDNRSVTRILGDLWANLADDEKSVYTNLAKQYKDAFMKANPDYKWHSTDRLPQPGKMSTRPSNVRPARSLSTSEATSTGHSVEGDKLAGLNLLLMAGQQSMPARDKQSVVSHVLEKKLTSPDLMGANSALLQLAEMCSTELNSRQMDSTLMHSAPPKKRARHWSHSDVDRSDLTDRHKIPNPSLFFQTIPNPSLPLPVKPQPPSATQTSQDAVKKPDPCHLPDKHVGGVVHPQDVCFVEQKQDGHLVELKQDVCLEEKKQDVCLLPDVKEESEGFGTLAPSDQSSTDGYLTQQQSKSPSADVGIPPKKKFTKLQDLYKGERPSPVTTATPAPATGGGCLSDQNDNAIFTCGKLVVNHIIDRLFSASIAASEQTDAPSAASPSSTDIEKVRKIITADMTEREKSQGPASKDMGRLLSEVVQKPQNLVEKVIEEAYNLDLKHMAGHEPVASCQTSTVVEKTELPQQVIHTTTAVTPAENSVKVGLASDPVRTGANTAGSPSREKPVKSEPVQADVKPAVEDLPVTAGFISQPSAPAREEREDRYVDDLTIDITKEEMGDFLVDDDDGYSQPVRKSRRRNRGQRYQELINEGIIQPSKERLAARRYEQVVIPVPQSVYGADDQREEETPGMERSHFALKRSISESDSNPPDEKRYRTGDFDLEAEIATLPPCSLDQVSRRRGARKRSDSESARKEEGGMPSSPVTATAQQPAVSAGPLTGSQKRKARKHSISRLVASSESGTNTRPPGIEASIPLVRDATVSPVHKPQPASATSTDDSSAMSTQPPTTPTTSHPTVVSPGEEKTSLHTSDRSSQKLTTVFENDGQISADAERTLKLENDSGAAERNDLTEKPAQSEKQKCSKKTSLKKAAESATSSAGSRVCPVDAEAKSCPSDLLWLSKQDTGDIIPVQVGDSSNICGVEQPPVHSLPSGKEALSSSSDDDHTARAETEAEPATGVLFQVSGSHNTTATQAACRGDRDTSAADISKLETSVEFTRIIPSHNPDPAEVKSNMQYVPSHTDSSLRDRTTRLPQLKDKLSRDSALGSSMENPEDFEKDSNPEKDPSLDEPQVFLSETSGLLCVAAESRPSLLSEDAQRSVSVDTVLSANQLQSSGSVRAAVGSNEQTSHAANPNICPILTEEEGRSAMEDTLRGTSRSPITTATADSPDNSCGNSVTVTVSSSGCYGQAEEDVSLYSSGEESSGPRVTTVTMATTDAMPTALSLEMMEQDGMVETGVGNTMLCGSPMPDSPSVTVVHS